MSVLTRIEEFTREELRKLLLQLKPEQIALFNRLYGSIDTIAVDRMARAIQQCEATITKNLKGGDINDK